MLLLAPTPHSQLLLCGTLCCSGSLLDTPLSQPLILVCLCLECSSQIVASLWVYSQMPLLSGALSGHPLPQQSQSFFLTSFPSRALTTFEHIIYFFFFLIEYKVYEGRSLVVPFFSPVPKGLEKSLACSNSKSQPIDGVTYLRYFSEHLSIIVVPLVCGRCLKPRGVPHVYAMFSPIHTYL